MRFSTASARRRLRPSNPRPGPGYANVGYRGDFCRLLLQSVTGVTPKGTVRVQFNCHREKQLESWEPIWHDCTNRRSTDQECSISCCVLRERSRANQREGLPVA